jgi:hypothetical protein
LDDHALQHLLKISVRDLSALWVDDSVADEDEIVAHEEYHSSSGVEEST